MPLYFSTPHWRVVSQIGLQPSTDSHQPAAEIGRRVLTIKTGTINTEIITCGTEGYVSNRAIANAAGGYTLHDKRWRLTRIPTELCCCVCTCSAWVSKRPLRAFNFRQPYETSTPTSQLLPTNASPRFLVRQPQRPSYSGNSWHS